MTGGSPKISLSRLTDEELSLLEAIDDVSAHAWGELEIGDVPYGT
jgi:hypothetical protein